MWRLSGVRRSPGRGGPGGAASTPGQASPPPEPGGRQAPGAAGVVLSPGLSAGNLWYRAGITPSYPQGSSWEHVSNNVRRVSVGPLDQVWVIADKVQGSHSLSRGTVCHRTGVQPHEPRGQGWDYGIGGGWDHISVRANATRAARGACRAQEPSAAQEAPGPVCC